MVYCPIPEYRPDVAGLNSQYTDFVQNLVPSSSGYVPFQELDYFDNFAFDEGEDIGEILKAFSVRDQEGQIYNFVATEKDIYLLKGSAKKWQNVSKIRHGYHAVKYLPWSFTVFGDYVVAVNKNDNPQMFHLKRSSCFEDIKGTPPRAAIAKVWGDFLCLMQLDGHPNRVYWSGLNDISCWELGKKFCDYQDFIEGGRVQGSSESKNPFIILEKAIYKGTFLPGSDLVFNFQKIHSGCGAISKDAIANRGEMIFFADTKGFFQVTQEGSLIPIGLEKVDCTFGQRINKRLRPTIDCIIDPSYNRVYWAFKDNNSKEFTELLLYDWALGKWSVISINVELVFSSFLPLISLYDWDKDPGDLDRIPYSFEDFSVKPCRPTLAAISGKRLGYYYIGKTLKSGKIYSPVLDPYGGRPVRVIRVLPHLQSQGLLQQNLELYSQDNLGKWQTIYRQRSYGQAFRPAYRLKVPFRLGFDFNSLGNLWTALTGFDIEIELSGQK